MMARLWQLCFMGWIALNGLSGCGSSPAAVPGDQVMFSKQQLTEAFIGEGVAVADVNQDGYLDVFSGAFWFEGPNWTQHRLAEAEVFDPAKGYSNAFLSYTMDVNFDGWADYIRVGWPGKEVVWYENPQNKSGLWTEHAIHDHFGNESPLFVDVDGDGRLDLIGNDPTDKQIVWLKSPNSESDLAWKEIVISRAEGIPGTHQYTHGLGFGDIDQDGFNDVVLAEGWWKNPGNPLQENWEFHPGTLSQPCAQMYLDDFNQDGIMDIVCSSAHKYGIWWKEQQRDSEGRSSWTSHLIDSSFSQSHSLIRADINRDGHLDLITGKRYFAHNGKDPGGHDAAVLYWYEYVPGSEPSWQKHLIDDNSGSGLCLVIEDMNGDGKLDIVTGNKKGVFVFYQN